jgi:hypothetical protein
MLDLVVQESWPGFVRQAEIFRPGGCMLSRTWVCRAADIAKVPLITARRPPFGTPPTMTVRLVADI